ncbi:hypothetical protein K402DRAFT_34299 [Aulographum hederae CBS 113979]|uniref:Uncharacterized protein n=1 Tax=Aulographum hederae CBS 113979 TaxID=1176131 RepID=A0A6G1H5T5_9PEZI|nr:hypothetical protein K402DRAFT_34299 [Aulographum hederae CBS 113979]
MAVQSQPFLMGAGFIICSHRLRSWSMELAASTLQARLLLSSRGQSGCISTLRRYQPLRKYTFLLLCPTKRDYLVYKRRFGTALRILLVLSVALPLLSVFWVQEEP